MRKPYGARMGRYNWNEMRLSNCRYNCTGYRLWVIETHTDGKNGGWFTCFPTRELARMERARLHQKGYKASIHRISK